jgi:hypothetical protein
MAKKVPTRKLPGQLIRVQRAYGLPFEDGEISRESAARGRPRPNRGPVSHPAIEAGKCNGSNLTFSVEHLRAG